MLFSEHGKTTGQVRLSDRVSFKLLLTPLCLNIDHHTKSSHISIDHHTKSSHISIDHHTKSSYISIAVERGSEGYADRVPQNKFVICAPPPEFAPYTSGAQGIAPLNSEGVMASQLDLPSLTSFSVAGCGRLQLGAANWAT